MTANRDKNSDIQIIRALAILLVIAQHLRSRLPTPDAYHDIFNYVMFWPGVDIFFAISGYLICKTFYRDIENSSTKRDALASFWQRRIARLLPAVIVWVILSIIISIFTNSTPNTNPWLVAQSAVTGIFGVSNIYWASCIQLSLQCGNPDYNAVTWSLSLEWQLYAISTILFSALGFKRGITWLAIIAIAMSILPAPSFSFPWVLRPQAFTIGAIVYIATKNRRITMRPLTSIAILLAGLLICILAPLNIPHPYMIPAISAGAGLCLISALSGRSLFAALPGNILEWIGERSYSIYLCHLPLILATREMTVRFDFNEPSYLNFLTSLIMAISLIAIAANLSYKYIEIPFQKRMAKRISSGAGSMHS